MKKMKYMITEALACVLGLLSFIFLFIPAVFEDSQPDLSIFNLMVGSERLASSPILIIGFISLLVGIIASLVLLVLTIMKKISSKLMTILSVVSIVAILIGSVISATAIFVSGFTELNSALGFNQGQWGIKAGTFLVPIFGLLSIVCLYPSALIILHEKDLKDKANKEEAVEETN